MKPIPEGRRNQTLPRARGGDSLSEANPNVYYELFPAHAGVIPNLDPTNREKVFSSPRTRG